MQKVVKLVIKICLICLFTIKINCQAIDDNYLLLHSVVELTKTQSDSSYYKLLKSVSQNKDKLEKYYNFKYFKKPIYKVLIGYDEAKDSLIYDEGENQKNRETIWSLKFKLMDSCFTKKDIECFMKQNELWVWNTDKISDNISVTKDNSLSFGNIVYKPYFSLNGKYALVQHESAKTFTSFYIFRKESDEWVFIDCVKNVWW